MTTSQVSNVDITCRNIYMPQLGFEPLPLHRSFPDLSTTSLHFFVEVSALHIQTSYKSDNKLSEVHHKYPQLPSG